MPAQLRRQFLSGGGNDPGAMSTPGMSDTPPGGTDTAGPGANPTSGPSGSGQPGPGSNNPTNSLPGSNNPTNGLPGSNNPTNGSPGSGNPTGGSGGGPGGSQPGGPGGSSTGDGGSGALPTGPVDGSPGGTVFGPHGVRRGLSPAAITAIVLAILLVLAIVAVAGRLLWRRRLERRPSFHTEPVPPNEQPEGASQTSFDWNPQMAERLRGGVIEPYNGSDSAESRSDQYHIEPFAVPPVPRRPSHVRTQSTTRLLDDAAAFGFTDEPGPSTGFAARRAEKLPRHPSSSGAFLMPPPPGALNLPHHRGRDFAQSTGSTPVGSPMSESDIVFELPPTYASLAPPRPVRRWYQIWPQSDHDSGRATEGHGGRSGSGSSGQATEGHGGRSGSGSSGQATDGHGRRSGSGRSGTSGSGRATEGHGGDGPV